MRRFVNAVPGHLVLSAMKLIGIMNRAWPLAPKLYGIENMASATNTTPTALTAEERPSDMPKYFNMVAGMVENDAAPKELILEAFRMMNLAIKLFEKSRKEAITQAEALAREECAVALERKFDFAIESGVKADDTEAVAILAMMKPKLAQAIRARSEPNKKGIRIRKGGADESA